jgi:hypothetical protein
MWNDLRTLFWLQWKLTTSMFRSRSLSDKLRILSLLARVIAMVFSLPFFFVMGIAVAVGLIILSPVAAYEAAMLINTFMFVIWLILPASYNSQLVERFEMSRLFPYPIEFRSVVVGSTLMSLLTMTGLWTVPILAGQVVGLAWHQPVALPLILLGALPVFALLALTGRVMEDLFDLVASDRRLRAIVLILLSLPFMACWAGQYVLQLTTDNFNNLPAFLDVPFLENLNRLDTASGPSEALEILRLSRLLIWLPPGWATAGMSSALIEKWGQAVLLLAFSIAFAVLMLRLHAGITRRLMNGAALRIGAARVKSRSQRFHLPGPPSFWALFQKDWAYIWRSPMPRRMLLSAVFIVLPVIVPLRELSDIDNATIRAALPLIVAAFAMTMVSMTNNMTITANYFGTIDREGFASLISSPVRRRYSLLASNLAVSIFTIIQYVFISAAIAIATGDWAILLLGPFLGLCLQIGGAPAYNLAAIIGPYRTQLKFSRGTRQRGNAWGLLAWITSAPPVLAMIVLPYIFWRPGLVLTLPLAVVYCVGLYTLTLTPLSRLLQRRERAILEAIITQK